MKKNDIIKLEIENYAFEGKGIAKISKLESDNIINHSDKKFVIFVHNSYPGDVVNAKIIKLKKSFAEAVTTEVIIPSKYRIKAKCKHYGVCGGCKQQDLDYSIQLKYKFEQVKDIFERLGGFDNFEILPIIPSQNIFHYRNKMEFSFTPHRWLSTEEINKGEITEKDFALGLHVPKIFNKVVNIEECYLQSEQATSVLNFTREFFKKKNTSIYSTFSNEGYLRNLVLRESFLLKDFMLNLVTFYENDNLMKEYSNELNKNFPFITTIINNINLRKAQIAIGDYEKVFLGNGFIYDKIGNYKFRISANSFFQTNSLQAEKLYQVASDFCEITGNEIVYDLYSGAGTIAIFISKSVKEVFGFESISSAIDDSKKNCEINNIDNVKSFEVDLNKSFTKILKENQIPNPDLIISDPPRSGMNPNTIKDILELEPNKIVYISCNPSTQARDIKLLCAEKYRLIKIQPVDMFPQTYHIENVALMKKN